MRIDETNTTRIALTIGKKNQEETASTSSAGDGGVDLSGITSNNMLASNFFDGDRQQSKYTAGLLDSLKIENSFGTKLQSLVQQGGLISPSDMDNYAKRNLAAEKAANQVEDTVEGEVSDKVGDEVEKNTDAMDEAVDKKLSGEQDQTAPADADAVETPAADGTDGSDTADVPVVEAAAQEDGTSQATAQAAAQPQDGTVPDATPVAQAEVLPGEYVDMVV
ncbi:MAG: hypothetical protein AB7D39_00475 [Pseudodesulfovibrio sp.]|uniref:hypothetical protein n=1 Tax=Pseudodesulfovibrio sp. TaxID=2035812 RepID=UPI003D0FC768